MEKVDKDLVDMLKVQENGSKQHALDAKAALDRLVKDQEDKQSSLQQLKRQQTSSRNNSSRSKRSHDDFDVDKELEEMAEEMKEFEDTGGEKDNTLADATSKASSNKRAKVGAAAAAVTASNEQDKSGMSNESENQSMSLNQSNEQEAIEESMKMQAEKESEEDV